MKIIYPTQSTKVPKALVEAVRREHEERKKHNPSIRMVDVWFELVEAFK